MAVDKDGSLYVADADNSRVVKLSADGELLAEWGVGTLPGQFSRPSDVMVDRRGGVYVADSGNARIQKLAR